MDIVKVTARFTCDNCGFITSKELTLKKGEKTSADCESCENPDVLELEWKASG